MPNAPVTSLVGRKGCFIFLFYSRFQLLGLLVTGSPALRVHGPLNPPPFSPSGSTILSTLTALTRVSRVAFLLTQNSRNFGWHIKWNGPFRFGPTGIFGTSFEGGPLWPVWSFRSVGPKCPFPFDKIVVPSTALLYPAYKNNNQTRGGLGRVCATGMYRSIGLGHVKFPKFQTGVFVEWKAP